jgi:hypothetical protein
MARIRTFKPDFFRHELLQEIEAKNPGKYPMFVFLGLWSVCDKQGVFSWKPRSLKLDIYPFLDYDMEETLQILIDEGFIRKFVAKEDGQTYGHDITFERHQRINGDEAKNPPKYPSPQEETPEKQERSNTEAGEKQERSGEENGKGKERERERERERETDERPKLVISLWQKNADIFNTFSSFKRPKDWKSFWQKSDITKEQIETAFKNYIQGVKSGAIERKYIPSNVDTFVINGWIQKSQEPYKVPQVHDPPKAPAPVFHTGKKSLGRLK